MTRTEYTADETPENGRAVSIEQAGEGVVLLMNNNGALPLKDSERSVSLIGCGSSTTSRASAKPAPRALKADSLPFRKAFRARRESGAPLALSAICASIPSICEMARRGAVFRV